MHFIDDISFDIEAIVHLIDDISSCISFIFCRALIRTWAVVTALQK